MQNRHCEVRNNLICFLDRFVPRNDECSEFTLSPKTSHSNSVESCGWPEDNNS